MTRTPRAAAPALIPILLLALAGCRSVGPAPPPEELAAFAPPPEIIVVERLVFVGEDPPPPSRGVYGAQAVRDAAAAGVRPPGEFSYAAMVFDFHRDWVFEVFASPLRLTAIILEPGERVTEPPFVADSERWIIGAGVGTENGLPVQHIYVKPVKHGLESSMIVNTDRRTYFLHLRSFQTLHMPMVRWRHPGSMPMTLLPAAHAAAAGTPAPAHAGAPQGLAVDPAAVSMAFRISGGRREWRPETVLHDGRHTFIVFPHSVLTGEFPPIFANRRDVANFRVEGRVAAVDGLWDTLTIGSGLRRVTVTRRRG